MKAFITYLFKPFGVVPVGLMVLYVLGSISAFRSHNPHEGLAWLLALAWLTMSQLWQDLSSKWQKLATELMDRYVRKTPSK